MIKINCSSSLLFTIFVGFVVYSNCQQPDLCRKKNRQNGGLFEHEEYCDYYWRCDSRKSEPYLQACPNGLGKGRGLYEFCGYPHLLKTCDGDVRYQAQEPVASENCPYSYGIFPHKTSCAKYWQCWNGTASEQKCGFQLLYNEEISSCDYPSNVKGCQKHPICKEIPNGPVLLKGSCILYWQCVGGYPRLERCPAGLAVNPRTLKCELATTIPECAPKVTTAKPVEPDSDEKDEKDEINETNEKPEKNEKRKNDSLARPLNAVAKAAKVTKETKDQNDPKIKDNKIIIIIKKPPPKPKIKLGTKPKVAKAQREIGASSSAPKHQKEVRKEAKSLKAAKSTKEVAGKPKAAKKEKEEEEVKATSQAKPAGKPKASNQAKSSGQAKVSNQAKPSNQTKPANEVKEKKKKKKQKQGQGLRSQ